MPGRYSLSVSVATHYKLWAGKTNWLLKNTIMHFLKSEYQSNASLIQLGVDSTGLRMGYLTLEVKVPSLSLIMLSFPVLEERDARGKFIRVQCVLSPLVL